MKGLQPLDVVLAAVPVEGCFDPRWCVVVAIGPGPWIRVMACSSQLDLYRVGQDFLFNYDHPDLKATGFKKTSYAIDRPIVELNSANVRKRYGRLEGQLAADFLKWLG